ncbi:MAG: alternative ribosome rescue aminoacyl-tRNA hydrolase ArfB [Patescibacteria group bacterium]|jgi:ribosome-associated protein
MPEIPDHELEYIFSRSSGKGGQNVNKTETRVQLRWNPFRSAILNQDDKELLRNSLKNRLTTNGDILVVCGTERSQFANLRKARHNLSILVENALKRPKKRLKTRPTKSARLKRLDNKRKISLKKISRRNTDY